MVALKSYLARLKKCSLRLLSFSVALTILIPLFSFFVVPVQAAAAEPAMKVNDLLVGGFFDLYIDGSFEGQYAGTTCNFSGKSVAWAWMHYSKISYDIITVTFQGEGPSSLQFYQNNLWQNAIYEGTVGDLHLYSFHNYTVGDFLQIRANYSSYGNRTFNLVSVLGYYDVSERVTSSRFGYSFYQASTNAWRSITWRPGMTYPTYISNSGTQNYIKQLSYVRVRPEDRQTEFAKSISFLVRCSGESPVFRAGLSDSDGNVITAFSNISYSVVDDIFYAGDDDINVDNLPQVYYLVTVDLEGYDLVGKTIDFQVEIDALLGYTYVSFMDCYIMANIDVGTDLWGVLFDYLYSIRETVAYYGTHIFNSLKNGVVEIVDNVKEGLGVGADTSVADNITNDSSVIHEAEKEYLDQLDTGQDTIIGALNLTVLAPALIWISGFLNQAFLKLGTFNMVYIVPLAIAYILFVFNRIPYGTIYQHRSNVDRSNVKRK